MNILLNLLPKRLALPSKLWPRHSKLRLLGIASLNLLFPLILFPLILTGCQNNPLASVTVSDDPKQAVADGDAKVKLAQEAEDKKSLPDAERLWGESASYYLALTQKKFPALSADEEASIHADAYVKAALLPAEHQVSPPLKRLDTSVRSLRTGLREFTREKFPKQHKQLTDALEVVSAQSDKMYETGQYKVAGVSYAPLWGIMNAILKVCQGNVVLAMFGIALFVTLALWPLRHKQFSFAKQLSDKMKVLQPEITKITEKYKDDPMLRMEKMNEFNKKHNIDIKGGCAPAIAQAPITYFMFLIISSYQFHFRDKHFLWINPTNGEHALTWPWPMTGFFGHHLGEPDILMVLLYCLSLFTQLKINQTPTTDPMQAEQQRMMNLMMPAMYFMFATQSPSAFIIYWFLSNLLGFFQMKLIYRGLPDTVLPDIKEVESLQVGNSTLSAGKTLKANPKLVSPKRKK